YGVLMPAWFVAIRGIGGAPAPGAGTYRAIAGGVLSLLTYFMVIFALTHAPIGAVSALRETSVVFTALLGHLFLGDRLTAGRLVACTVIAPPHRPPAAARFPASPSDRRPRSRPRSACLRFGPRSAFRPLAIAPGEGKRDHAVVDIGAENLHLRTILL